MTKRKMRIYGCVLACVILLSILFYAIFMLVIIPHLADPVGSIFVGYAHRLMNVQYHAPHETLIIWRDDRTTKINRLVLPEYHQDNTVWIHCKISEIIPCR